MHMSADLFTGLFIENDGAAGGSGARGDVAASAAGGGASATGEADGLARLHVGGSGGGAGQQAAIYTGWWVVVVCVCVEGVGSGDEGAFLMPL